MRRRGSRRQIALFLVAVLAPCLVLAALAVRLVEQERELAGKRRADESRRVLEHVRAEVLAHLERLKAGAVRGKPDPAVVLVARIEDSRPALPWESGEWERRFRELVSQAPFESYIRRGEQAEFSAGQLPRAAAAYQQALAAARHPLQRAHARLLLARTLDKLGRKTEAEPHFAALLRLGSELRDEDGVPMALFAAERQLAAGGEVAGVLGALETALKSSPSPPAAGCYLLSELAGKLGRRALDDEQRGALARIRQAVSERIRDLDQAAALAADFPRLAFPRDGSAGWILFGDPPWLVNRAPGPSNGPVLVALRAAPLLEDLGKRLGQVRFLLGRDSGGEPLGGGLAGLRVALTLPPDEVLQRREALRLAFYGLTLATVLGLTLFSGWLLWRDLGRDLRLVEMRSHFVASVSHELKTPLTAIRLLAETLQMGRGAESGPEYLETIVTECERLSRLVDNVLAFSKIEQGRKVYQFRPSWLPDILYSAARTLRHPLEQQGFDLRLDVTENIPETMADADALEQAVLNLLSNAIKYSGPARSIELSLRAGNGHAVIAVADHGLGIPADQQSRIFEEFYRVPTPENQRIPGTGLGLALVRHIVNAHGGQVEVRSTPGEGSTFLLRLPIKEPA